MKKSDQPNLFSETRAKTAPAPEIYPHQVEAVARRVHQELALKAMRFGEKREIAIACPCSFRPYPHILTEEYSQDRNAQGAAR